MEPVVSGCGLMRGAVGIGTVTVYIILISPDIGM